MKSILNPICILILLTVYALPVHLFAQLSKGGLPSSFSLAIAPDTGNVVTITPPSVDKLALEDQKTPLPYRFAVNLPADLELASAGQMFPAANGTRVWRLNIKSPGAHGLILYFDRFHIPEGGSVYVYNTRRTQLLGAFTALNNNNISTFATGLIFGDELTIEYNAPAELPLPDLHISEVGHAYRGISERTDPTGFKGSGICEVNINCQEGVNWQKQKRSVTRIAVKRNGSSFWCTGSLLDNTRHDGKPYGLTADHCGKGTSVTDVSQWIFYFNYEGAGCPDPTAEPALKSMTGASLVAHGGDAGNTGSDFFLVLLKSNIPESYNVYYNGWNRETIPPSPSGTCIHHPQGDIKKISTYTSSLQPAHWVGNPALCHWRVSWSGTPDGHGTTEGGSSGSPLFDNQGFLVGTLTGGDSGCDSVSLNLPDYYGMFSYSWDKNGTDSLSILKCWLDPDNTGLMSLQGWSWSVGKPLENSRVTIWPNPVTDRLNLKSTMSDGKIMQVTLTDVLGNTLVRSGWNMGSDQEKQVDMSRFASGVYFLRITDGEHRIVRKLIKQ